MTRPRDQLEPLRAAIDGDRRRLCDALGLRPHNGRYFCPFCQSDGKPHEDGDFSIEAGFRCHKCGWKGDGFKLVREINSCDFVAAMKLIRSAYAMPSSRVENPAQPKPRKIHATLDACAAAALWSVQKDTSKQWKETRRDLYGDPEAPAPVEFRFDREDGAKDEDGKPIKTFRTAHAVEGGFTLGDPPGKLQLFNLPEILHYDGSVVVCEGPKSCRAADSLGMLATTSAHGAKGPELTDWTPLKGRDLVVFPDNDTSGRAYAETVGRLAIEAGARTVRIVELPGLHRKGDICDFLNAWTKRCGGDIELAALKAAAEILRLTQAAPLWKAKAAANTDPSDIKQQSDPVTPVCWRDLLSSCPAPRDPVFEGVVDMGRFGVVIAKAKMRKSFFTMQMGVAIAAGRDFLAWKNGMSRRVMIVQFEVHKRDLHERVFCMSQSLGLTQADASDKLLFFNVKASAWDGGGPEAIQDIQEAAIRHHAEVVIVDPLFRLMNQGDESIEFLRPLILALDRMSVETGALVLVVHHDTKGQSGDRELVDRGSGSNILGRSAYWLCSLTPHANGDANFICVDQTGNGYPAGESFSAEFVDGRFVYRPDIYGQRKQTSTGVKSRQPPIDALAKYAKTILGDQVMPLSAFTAKMCAKMGLSKQREIDARAILESECVIIVSEREKARGGKKYVGIPSAMEAWHKSQ